MGICTCIKNISLNQNAAVPVSAKRKVSSLNKESDFGLMQNDDSNINSRAGDQATTFESVILREINIARTRPKDYADKLKVVKVNADECAETVKANSISGLPSLLIFKNGEAVERMVGLMPKSTIVNNIEKHL